MVVNINISLLYSNAVVRAKMLKETEKTLGFVVIIFIIGGISIGRGADLLPPPPLGYDYDKVGSNKPHHGKFSCLLLAKL